MTLELVTSPVSPGRYAVTLDGRIVCASARTPLFSAARVLLAEGVDLETIITTRHQGSTIVSLRSTVGVAAKWTVLENATSGPRFVPYRTLPDGAPHDAVGWPARTAKSGSRAPMVAAE